MLRDEEKAFFASIAVGAAGISGGPERDGAVIVREREILSYGSAREINAKDGSWVISGIMSAIIHCNKGRCSGTEIKIFCSRFPNLEEMKAIVSTDIETVYFFGKVSDSNTVKFVNAVTESVRPLEIIKLER